MLLQLNELEKIWNESYENARIYEDKMKKWHNQCIAQRTSRKMIESYCLTLDLDYFQEN